MSNNASSCYAYLCEKGYTPKSQLKIRRTLVCKENGVTYRLDNLDGCESAEFLIDGNIINGDTPRCDRLLLIKYGTPTTNLEQWVQIFVELKGGDIERAVEQIVTTVSNSMFNHSTNISRRARIITKNRIPSNGSNPEIEKAKKLLAKKYKCYLRCLKSGNPERFEV